MLRASTNVGPFIATYDMVERTPYDVQLVQNPDSGAEGIRFSVTSSTVIVTYDGISLHMKNIVDLSFWEKLDGTTTTVAANLPKRANLTEYWVSMGGNVSVKSESVSGTMSGRVPEIYPRHSRHRPWYARSVLPYSFLDILCNNNVSEGREATWTSATVERIASPDDPTTSAIRLTWWHKLEEIPGMAEQLTPDQREAQLSNKVQVVFGLNPPRRLQFQALMGPAKTDGPWAPITSWKSQYLIHGGVPIPSMVEEFRGASVEPETSFTLVRFEDAQTSVSEGISIIPRPPTNSRMIRDNRKGRDAKPEELQLSAWPTDAVVVP